MKPILIAAKYPSRCVFCGRDIEVGEPVLYQSGAGVAHPNHFSTEEREDENLLFRYRENKNGK